MRRECQKQPSGGSEIFASNQAVNESVISVSVLSLNVLMHITTINILPKILNVVFIRKSELGEGHIKVQIGSMQIR